MGPVPEAKAPIAGLLLVHAKVVPATPELNTSVVVFALLHTVWLVGVTVIIGVGFTFIVNVCIGPRQLFAVGVTVKLPAICVVPVLVAVNEGIKPPEPDDSTPIAGLLLFHV